LSGRDGRLTWSGYQRRDERGTVVLLLSPKEILKSTDLKSFRIHSFSYRQIEGDPNTKFSVSYTYPNEQEKLNLIKILKKTIRAF